MMSWLVIIPLYIVTAFALAMALGRMLRGETRPLSTDAVEEKPRLAATEPMLAGAALAGGRYPGPFELSEPSLKAS
jgi:hypothetical protein